MMYLLAFVLNYFYVDLICYSVDPILGHEPCDPLTDNDDLGTVWSSSISGLIGKTWSGGSYDKSISLVMLTPILPFCGLVYNLRTIYAHSYQQPTPCLMKR